MQVQAERQVENYKLETITAGQLDSELVKKLPFEFLKKQCAIPLVLDDGQVGIALSDPLNIEAYDAIVSVLARACVRVICPASEIEKAISRCYYHSGQTEQADCDQLQKQVRGDGEDSRDVGVGSNRAEDLLNVANKAPVVKQVNKILFQAVHSRASDIHIEPYDSELRIRFRIDGVLHNVCVLDRRGSAALISRLKIMANLNIAEQRLPQDGQSRVQIGKDLMDIRVSTIPTLAGERVVLRLLDKSNSRLGLEDVGFGPELLRKFRSLIGLTHGIILLTGPTGSGKTTTLYAALNELNSEHRNILTVEDPVEYHLPGVGQMQVKPKIGLNFSDCLRHILRQDPNVIMIGEIRDAETARIAIQASLTGHLVLSTLHTNDSASAVTRLVDMGIEPYLISSTVAAVMAQRLVRVICPKCKSHSKVSERNMAEGEFFVGSGCESCLKTGYLGRTGIFELLVVDDDIKALMGERADSHIIKAAAIKKGMNTLRQDGLRKARAGETTLKEIYRVTQDCFTEGIENASC